MNCLRYTISVALVVVAHLAVLNGGWWTLALPLFLFGFVPAIELLNGGTKLNEFAGKASELEAGWKYDTMI